MSDTCRYTGKPLDKCRCKEGCDPTTVTANEWIQPIRKGYSMACCDCGLVHMIDFRIHKGKIQFRADRDEKATTKLRKRMRVTVRNKSI